MIPGTGYTTLNSIGLCLKRGSIIKPVDSGEIGRAFHVVFRKNHATNLL